ncbi:hypothetical protein QFZ63_003767 [Streptomyces sp. B3I7]|uniref:hypothetical protein n=1 Tax=Streptomyces sp. B3I7 TaxID=3042269 RepID=UPI0027800812|nr:hypothetical protein [Streptomyces sp. B3I7]MDQ0812053.1 hypothetical protein [Streptomyces sp. B3I7]
MTQPMPARREPDAPETAAGYFTEPRPDGSTVLTLLTPGAPGVLLEHRFLLDLYLTRSLLRALARDLADVPDPGPRPEAAALFDAVRTGDRTALANASDAINTRILGLWTDRGEAA